MHIPEAEAKRGLPLPNGISAKDAVRLKKPYLNLDQHDLLQRNDSSQASWTELTACQQDNGTTLGRYSYPMGKTMLYVDYRLKELSHNDPPAVDIVEIMQREQGEISQHGIIVIDEAGPIFLAGSLDFSDFDRVIALRNLAHSQTTKRELASFLKTVLEFSEIQKLRSVEPPQENAIFPQK